MFSVVNVYLDHLKFCIVYINGRRYVCCSECYVVSNGSDIIFRYIIPYRSVHFVILNIFHVMIWFVMIQCVMMKPKLRQIWMLNNPMYEHKILS